MRALAILVSSAVLALGAHAIDETDSEVRLENDCSDLMDCVETVPEIVSWLALRNPGPGDRVVVNVGSGTHTGQLHCGTLAGTPWKGWATFRGEGQGVSVLSNSIMVVFGVDCSGLEFVDLTLDMTSNAAFPTVLWRGDNQGDSTWTRTTLSGAYVSWYDSVCAGGGASSADGPQGEHFFFDTKFHGGVQAFVASCGISWIYDSEIKAVVDESTPNTLHASPIGVLVSFRGDVRLFNSEVSVDTTACQLSTDLQCANVDEAIGIDMGKPIEANPGGDGVFHMHGGRIAVDAGTAPAPPGTPTDVVYGIRSRTYGDPKLVHTPGTDFSLSGRGPIHRLDGDPFTLDGKVLSPFTWPFSSQPPNIESQVGQDQYPDLSFGAFMVYDPGCTPERWRNVTTNECR